ncbi:MAG: hypothetical protein HY708_03545 [Ignavibacteriae bacterium]|nr:hypothetical protein [Ignavibacteriota bacterium]
MKKFFVVLTAGLLGLAIVFTLTAQEKKAMKEVTITGEIIDTKCYVTGMMGGRGEEHKQCAIDCIKGGLPVGIVENKTDKVYVVVARSPSMKGANEELVEYAAERVKLTGNAVEKGGQKLFVYTKVEKVE